ncbi:Uma2 family endonuclease [Nocardia sp. NEAU-G5]|uniref:Uma2 family endonuclease n=1 Tax=Nocardia albiluteola TaxID=2842303 RepID=A0ABS6B0N0_9NOCA|nr:Uma2 family endonuclease [Nocardia albiluteola]MBU3063857.1 Uma2 family endonuclease [Nocardia albiluteola]
MTAEVATIHPLGPTTVDDWLAMDHPDDGSRLELILGYLHTTPPPGGSHQKVTFRLARLLDDAIEVAGRVDLEVLPGVGVRLSTPFRTGVIPDISIVDTDAEHTSFSANNLLLAVEVWSPGNTREERDTKIAAYAGAQVRYLWIVELPKKGGVRFWGYELDGGGYSQRVYADAGEVITAPGPAPVKVSTAQLR